MQRDFTHWLQAKKQIDGQADTSGVYFAERDLWWCRLGANIGHEQDGKGASFSRPVLILKKFNRHLFWAVPLSTKLKPNAYYIPFMASDHAIRAAMISQLRLMSGKRLTDKIGVIPDSSFRTIRKAIRDLL